MGDLGERISLVNLDPVPSGNKIYALNIINIHLDWMATCPFGLDLRMFNPPNHFGSCRYSNMSVCFMCHVNKIDFRVNRIDFVKNKNLLIFILNKINF